MDTFVILYIMKIMPEDWLNQFKKMWGRKWNPTFKLYANWGENTFYS